MQPPPSVVVIASLREVVSYSVVEVLDSILSVSEQVVLSISTHLWLLADSEGHNASTITAYSVGLGGLISSG